MNFTITGTIAPLTKDKGIENRTNPTKTWVSNTYVFTVNSGTNHILVKVKAGERPNATTISTLGVKNDGDEKYPNIEIPKDARTDQANIDRVASFKKYKMYLAKPGDSDEVKKEHNVSYIYDLDFVKNVYALVNKKSNVKFKLSGTVEYSYSDKTGTWYTDYVVNAIYRLADPVEGQDEAPDYAKLVGEVDFCAEDVQLIDDSTLSIMTRVPTKVNKRDYFVPVPMIWRAPDPTTCNLPLAHKVLTSLGDTVKAKVVANIIHGAQRKELTLNDLSEAQRSLIEAGMMTLDACIRDLGSSAYGPSVDEFDITACGNPEPVQIDPSVLKQIPLPAAFADKAAEVATPFANDDLFDIL